MNPPKVLIIQNNEIERLGWYEQYPRDKVIEYDVFRAYEIQGAGKDFRTAVGYDSFIVGGFPEPANEYRKYDFLTKEFWGFIDTIMRINVREKLRYLAVCGGAQLTAKCLGAQVKRSPKKEIGVYKVRLTEHGKTDPLFAGFPEEFPVFQWHNDMFEVPDYGQLLVKGGPSCPIQAFGYENMRALLFHLELDSDEVAKWADAYRPELEDVGKTKEEVVAECEAKEPEMKELAYQLMDNFFTIVQEK